MEVSQRSALLKKKVQKGEEELIELPHQSTIVHPWTRFVPFLLVIFLMIIIFGCLCAFLVYLFPASILVTVDLIDVKKCPACAGQSICPVFYRKEVRLNGHCVRKVQSESEYPVHGCEGSVGLYNDKRSVRIRRCASPGNLSAIDEAVCRRGLRQGLATAPESVRRGFSCIPHLAIWRWRPTNEPSSGEPGESVETPLYRGLVVAPPIEPNSNHSESPNLEHLPTTFGPATRCSSDRLFNHLQAKFRERTSPGAETRWLRFDELMFLFNLAIDPHPILVQSFPRDQGWPFPKYTGSCGRWFVEENHGVSLDNFCLAPVWLRLRILANILTIPERLVKPIRLQNHSPHLTSDDDSTDGYAIYLGDFDLASLFYVDPHSFEVTLSNLRHAIVVDIETLSEFGFGFKEEHSVSPGATDMVNRGLAQHKCLGNVSHSGDAGGPTPPCMTREHADQLCSHLHSDHNYWAICSALVLNREDNLSCNFLEHMPQEVVALLNQCVHRHGPGVRQNIVQQALGIIQSAIETNPMSAGL